ncbi:MAG: sensor histidine kinase KdpD [Alphaproteobacteria bacterium]|nr:sensor histidine kinase KdpD [Alphaproteobacteria bacterium]
MMDDRGEQHHRPSPDALLRQATQESRGRLKIFLGAAPGVGKTYEMLQTAQAKRRQGVDVAVGLVETHNRRETEKLLEGLEVVPRRGMPYRGLTLDEMDLDALLKRRPQLAIVDELAHTNAPGCRHPKRYLDVEELLAAGIDVYTTLNIQHVESLNDVVARITRIRIRETVPDSIIDNADDIELVDLTPADLVQRLNEGKVYVPEHAERATRHYFQPGNLTALRELALRRTAQRVDEQMVDYMRAHAIEGPWPAAERLLVGVNHDPRCASVVRYTRRLADRLRAPWSAVHIETSQSLRLTEEQRDRVAECLRLAQRLGGETVTVPGTDVAEGMLSYARSNNYTHLVIAKSRRPRWLEWLRGSTTHHLIRQAGDISVHVIAEPTAPRAARESSRPPSVELAHSPPPLDAGPLVAAGLFVAAALGLSLALQQFVGIYNIALVLLTSVLATAVTYGLWPSLLACLLSVLAYNFFFLPPLYTFTIADPENVVALVVFAIVAIIASNLTARVRAQAVTARQRAATTEDLYLFARKLSAAVTLDDLLWATAFQMASMLKVNVVLLLPDENSVSVRAAYPPEDTLGEADLAAAKWCWEHNEPAGRGADTLPGAKRLFMPIGTSRGVVAVAGLDNDRDGPLLSPDQHRLLKALADQAALAVERMSLAQDVERAQVAIETEQLRTALLTSISHDLRTPLASVLGSVTSLRDFRHSLDDAAQDELIGTIQEEAERLSRFIANLLDMTKLEAGAVTPRAEPVDTDDIVGSALERAGKVLAKHRVKVNLGAKLPMLKLDPVLFEQVLFNVLDNAAKYATDGTEIELRVQQDESAVRFQIIDEGPGIPAADLERIFDKFYRARAADNRRVGTGLGLAICKGFVDAMGGTIDAGNRNGRSGAVFTISFPLALAHRSPAKTIA